MHFPAGLLSRDAARLTETFIFTVGVGDDFVMRLGVDSIENLRTGIIQTLHASKLPKVSEWKTGKAAHTLRLGSNDPGRSLHGFTIMDFSNARLGLICSYVLIHFPSQRGTFTIM